MHNGRSEASQDVGLDPGRGASNVSVAQECFLGVAAADDLGVLQQTTRN